MSETMSKWDRFNNFMNKTMVPMSWLALVLGLGAIVTSIINHDYDVWFWLAIAITAWAAYDVVKYYRQKRKSNDVPDFGDPSEV